MARAKGTEDNEKDSFFPPLAGSVIGDGRDRHDKRVPGCNLNVAQSKTKTKPSHAR